MLRVRPMFRRESRSCSGCAPWSVGKAEVGPMSDATMILAARTLRRGRDSAYTICPGSSPRAWTKNRTITEQSMPGRTQSGLPLRPLSDETGASISPPICCHAACPPHPLCIPLPARPIWTKPKGGTADKGISPLLGHGGAADSISNRHPIDTLIDF